MLHPPENVRERPQPRFPGRETLRRQRRHPDEGVQFIYRAVAFQSGMILRRRLPADEPRFARVSLLRINLAEFQFWFAIRFV